MPRLQPPTGYISAAKAAELLNVTDAMLSLYVKEGKLSRYGPADRKHKFYKLSEVNALVHARSVFEEDSRPYVPGQWRKNPVSTFRVATEYDIPLIMAMNERAFPPEGLPLYSTWKTWLDHEPESLHVVANAESIVVGYIALLLMRPAALAAFLQNELAVDDIGPEHLEVFRPGAPLHMYVMSVCVDPQYAKQERGEYSMRLLTGVFAFFLDLARRGVEIVDITTRALSRDGLRLTRKLGLPQIKSPIPGRNLFRVTVAESGARLFEDYSALLQEWKDTIPTPEPHQSAKSTPVHRPQPRAGPARQPRISTDNTITGGQLAQLEGTITLAALAAELGINRTTLLGHVLNDENKLDTGRVVNKKNGLEHMAYYRTGRERTPERDRRFTPEQATRFKEWHQANSKKKHS